MMTRKPSNIPYPTEPKAVKGENLVERVDGLVYVNKTSLEHVIHLRLRTGKTVTLHMSEPR